jgi:putative ABC transport system permease protein
MLKESFNLALKSISKRKLRSWLTVIGIVISIATIFVLVALSLGLQGAIEKQFEEFGTDKFFISPRGQLGPPGSTSIAVELTEDDIKVIEKVNGVKDISYWTVANAEVEYKDEKRFFLVGAFPLDSAELFTETGFYKIDEGRFIKEGDSGVIMVGSQYKYNNVFDKPIGEGDKLKINGKEFRVKTVLKSVGNPQDDRFILMSMEDLRELFDIPTRIDQITVQVENEEEIQKIAESVKRKLDKSRGVDDKTRDFTILTPDSLLETFGIILNVITGFLLGVALISLLVGGIGIANTTYTSVIERTKEIGLMKAIGAKNSDILEIFVVEAGLLGLIGGIIGVLLGIGIGWGIEFIAVEVLATSILQVDFPIWLMVGCLAFAFLSGAVSGLIPAWQASKTNVVEALRYE